MLPIAIRANTVPAVVMQPAQRGVTHEQCFMNTQKELCRLDGAACYKTDSQPQARLRVRAGREGTQRPKALRTCEVRLELVQVDTVPDDGNQRRGRVCAQKSDEEAQPVLRSCSCVSSTAVPWCVKLASGQAGSSQENRCLPNGRPACVAGTARTGGWSSPCAPSRLAR